MLNFHGFSEFVSNSEQLRLKQQPKDDLLYRASWCNIVSRGNDGRLLISGYQSQLYQKKINNFHGPDVVDAMFLGQDLVVFNSDRLSMISEKNCEYISLTIPEVKPSKIKRLESTERDLLLLLDSNECLSCKNIQEEIKQQSVSSAMQTLSISASLVCSDVQEISCGKEHVVILDTSGSVFTFGNGSRGQLGHGTVDSCQEPKLVESLAGLKMVSVAAGGWHSVAVSECGDIYCWGWNESGQLGLPSPSVQAKSQSPSVQAKSYSVFNSIQQSLESSNVETSRKDRYTSQIQKANVIQCTPKTIDIDPSETMVFIQNIDPVQIQSLPCIVDFVDKFNIGKVSCGSRHTALLSDTGVLLTSGWNDYGQLCQNDQVTRDYFETVSNYCKQNLKVKNVYCGPWSTIILS